MKNSNTKLKKPINKELLKMLIRYGEDVIKHLKNMNTSEGTDLLYALYTTRACFAAIRGRQSLSIDACVAHHFALKFF